jgi:D-alanyl-D-alanine carboxypeptidase
MIRRATTPALFASALCLAFAAVTTGRLRAQDIPTAFVRSPATACWSSYDETADLVPVGPDVAGRTQRLRPEAAAAWRGMQRAAKADGVTLLLVSAFRSVDEQRQIFERKLRAGQTLEDILAVNVPPGFSQHHTGAAIDLGTPGSTALLEDFGQTAAFRWLRAHAQDHGFSLSYPRGNASGLNYEPWHWAFGAFSR